MSARAEESERLSAEIVESLTSGLLVVASEGNVRILNPAGQRLLGLAENALDRTLSRSAREPRAAGTCYRRMPQFRSSRRPSQGGDGIQRHGPGLPRRQRFAAVEPPGRAPRRHLPVHRSHAIHRDGGTASPEGEPGPGRRVDGRYRARIQKRPRDDSWLRAPHRSQRVAGFVPAAPRWHSSGDRRAWRGRHELPQFRAADADVALACRSCARSSSERPKRCAARRVPTAVT